MTQKLISTAQQQIESLVNELLNEESVFHPLKGDREGRSALRREFVRAISVELADGQVISGYCGNISTAGIELVTRSTFLPNAKAMIRVESADSESTFDFVAECRWCIDHGEGGVTSGWYFINALV